MDNLVVIVVSGDEVEEEVTEEEYVDDSTHRIGEVALIFKSEFDREHDDKIN